AGHDALAFRHAVFYFVVVAELSAQLHDARFKLAFAFIDEDHIARASRHDRADGDHKSFTHLHAKLDIGIHSWLQPEIRVRDVDAHFGGSLHLIDEWIDERDFAFQLFARIRLARHTDFLALLEHRELAFVKV